MTTIEVAKRLIENNGKPILCKTEYDEQMISGVDFAEDTERPFIISDGTSCKKAKPLAI